MGVWRGGCLWFKEFPNFQIFGEKGGVFMPLRVNAFNLFYHLNDVNELADENIEQLRRILKYNFNLETLLKTNITTDTDLGLLTEKPVSFNKFYRIKTYLDENNVNYPMYDLVLDVKTKEHIDPYNDKFDVYYILDVDSDNERVRETNEKLLEDIENFYRKLGYNDEEILKYENGTFKLNHKENISNVIKSLKTLPDLGLVIRVKLVNEKYEIDEYMFVNNRRQRHAVDFVTGKLEDNFNVKTYRVTFGRLGTIDVKLGYSYIPDVYTYNFTERRRATLNELIEDIKIYGLHIIKEIV